MGREGVFSSSSFSSGPGCLCKQQHCQHVKMAVSCVLTFFFPPRGMLSPLIKGPGEAVVSHFCTFSLCLCYLLLAETEVWA